MADISKIKFGGTTYTVKDSTARDNLSTLLGTHSLEALSAVAWKSIVATFDGNEDNGDLVDVAALKSYVGAQVGAINKFDVVLCEAAAASVPAGAKYTENGQSDITGTLVAASTTMYKIYLVKNKDAGAGAYLEYITIDNGAGASTRYTWESIGSTKADLTSCVPTSRTVAGLALSSDISDSSLKTALGLGALAYKSSASGTYSGETISGVKASGTPLGSISVTLGETATAASLTTKEYTPSGSVSIAADSEGFAVTGTNASSAVSFSGGTTETVLTSTVATAAVAPSLGSATTGSFTTEGVVVSIGTGTDDETLIISAASTSSAVTAQGTFSAGSAPVYETATVVKTIGTATAAAQSFTGGKIKATFSGTKVSDYVSGVNYEKASVSSATFTGSSTEFDVGNITVSSANITVE